MTDIRGIHHEVSEPRFNETDGYWYQRVRQVDEHGNLVGTGDQLIRLPNRGSTDGHFSTNVDFAKLGKLAGDVGQVVVGAVRRDPGIAARGTIAFG